MGMRIHQLPPAIANQIAAGEVIERPASVVKELLENSFDAGADSIAIEIGYGGLNQIKISDNGTGIMADDLPLAITAHATSKISTLDDLFAIGSMGFRGEALASIASVAKVTISSSPAQQEHAMMLRVHGAETTITPCARTVGTTIDVVDLFFNAPVRKRFLKSEQLEFQAIETVIKRFALSAPSIALNLKHNGKQVLSLPPATNEETRLIRMTRIFGSAFVKNAVSLDVECGAMRLYGWVSDPNFQRSQNDRQWVYINQRMVKDKLINHALKQAYDGLLYPGRFPACLLYLTINSAEVDVNVHPTKHEVRFQQPRLVHDFFTSQLTRALNTKPLKNIEPAYEVKPDYALDGAKFICEPYPQLLPLQTVAEIDLPWVILNNRYILAFIQQQPYMVDIVTVQQIWIQEQLSQLVLPWEERPLLVPFCYSSSEQLKKNAPLLGQLGIHIKPEGKDKLLITSIPLKVPYLDLRLFLDTLTQFAALDLELLIEQISKSQVFDPRLLSRAEKMELNQILLQMQKEENRQSGVFKSLTVDDCRKLVHV